MRCQSFTLWPLLIPKHKLWQGLMRVQICPVERGMWDSEGNRYQFIKSFGGDIKLKPRIPVHRTEHLKELDGFV